MDEKPEGWFWIDYEYTRGRPRGLHYFRDDDELSLCGKYHRSQIKGTHPDPEDNPRRCMPCIKRKKLMPACWGQYDAGAAKCAPILRSKGRGEHPGCPYYVSCFNRKHPQWKKRSKR